MDIRFDRPPSAVLRRRIRINLWRDRLRWMGCGALISIIAKSLIG